MIAVMWAYEGWAYLAFAAGEVRDPARTLPSAFIYGTLGLTIVYVLVNVGYFVAATRRNRGRHGWRRRR